MYGVDLYCNRLLTCYHLFLSGFTHAAFALGYEAGINRTPIDGNLIPPGALVTFVQKGLQYIELEANLDGVSAYVSLL